MWPFDIKKKELGPNTTMDNALDLLVDVCITDEACKARKLTGFNHYRRIAMVLLWWKEDVTNEMAASDQCHSNKLFLETLYLLIWVWLFCCLGQVMRIIGVRMRTSKGKESKKADNSSSTKDFVTFAITGTLKEGRMLGSFALSTSFNI